MKETMVIRTLVDLPTLVSELQLRGFDQEKVDAALRCLVHVQAVQDATAPDIGGILAEDIVNTYPLEVVQAATQLFLETTMTQGREVFRVRWGCGTAAKTMEWELWNHSRQRWDEFVSQLDERYLGFFLPAEIEGARVTSSWKLNKELKWFSVELPQYGWKVLGMMDDITEVAWKLDLAFGFRPFSQEGVAGERVLLHEAAYNMLEAKKAPLPPELLKSIRLWKFFSEYDVQGTDFVALMKECGLTLDDLLHQIEFFFSQDLTSQYRDGQYPPYFINDKKKKEFQAAVRALLGGVESWLSRTDVPPRAAEQEPNPQTETTPNTVTVSQT